MSNAIWHPERVTYGKSYVVHLNVWLSISHMIDDAIKEKKRIKKKEKENNNNNNNKIKINKKYKRQMESRDGGRRALRERILFLFFFFFSLLSQIYENRIVGFHQS